jgi:shikimate kinase
MASGKTSVGRALAGLLDCPIADLDEVISRREGRSISAIVEQEGESFFRQRETAALAYVLQNRPSVIALGGGAWLMERNRRLISDQDCLTVWLDAPFELCWKRINRGRKQNRPFARDYDQTRTLYENRRPLYRLAIIHLETNGNRTVDELAAEILSRCYEWRPTLEVNRSTKSQKATNVR